MTSVSPVTEQPFAQSMANTRIHVKWLHCAMRLENISRLFNQLWHGRGPRPGRNSRFTQINGGKAAWQKSRLKPFLPYRASD